MNNTEYYNLYKPEQYDEYDVDIFNDNADIIDRELHNIAEIQRIPPNLGELGMGYGLVNQFEDNIANVPIHDYAPIKGSNITVKFTCDVPANAKLDVSRQGPVPIYYLEAPITGGVIGANTLVSFVYDGEHYNLVGTQSDSQVFVGTQDEFDEAAQSGTIHENTFVVITDDNN